MYRRKNHKHMDKTEKKHHGKREIAPAPPPPPWLRWRYRFVILKPRGLKCTRTVLSIKTFYRYILSFIAPYLRTFLSFRNWLCPIDPPYKVTSLTMLPHNVFRSFVGIWKFVSTCKTTIIPFYTDKVFEVPTEYERNNSFDMWKCENFPTSLIRRFSQCKRFNRYKILSFITAYHN